MALKRQLNRCGISPVKIKYDEDLISHKVKGSGMVVVDWGKPDRAQKTFENLEKMGYHPEKISTVNELYHSTGNPRVF